jgi:endogenous inhibitor of DNA gyrase (YacG/DUF329 family)
MRHRYDCPTCGKPAPKLSTTVWVERDPGNYGPDTPWTRTIIANPRPHSMEGCRRLTNRTVISVAYSMRGEVTRFGEWDGESYWHPHEPFCTTGCALAFARAAYKTGHRLVAPKERVT